MKGNKITVEITKNVTVEITKNVKACKSQILSQGVEGREVTQPQWRWLETNLGDLKV